MVHFRTAPRYSLQRWCVVYHRHIGVFFINDTATTDIYTLQAWLIPGLGIEDMRPEDVLEGWVGARFDYEILQANPWTANFVVAQRYRKGRAIQIGRASCRERVCQYG